LEAAAEDEPDVAPDVSDADSSIDDHMPTRLHATTPTLPQDDITDPDQPPTRSLSQSTPADQSLSSTPSAHSDHFERSHGAGPSGADADNTAAQEPLPLSAMTADDDPGTAPDVSVANPGISDHALNHLGTVIPTLPTEDTTDPGQPSTRNLTRLPPPATADTTTLLPNPNAHHDLQRPRHQPTTSSKQLLQRPAQREQKKKTAASTVTITTAPVSNHSPL
jgi:hypothetical protein